MDRGLFPVRYFSDRPNFFKLYRQFRHNNNTLKKRKRKLVLEMNEQKITFWDI